MSKWFQVKPEQGFMLRGRRYRAMERFETSDPLPEKVAALVEPCEEPKPAVQEVEQPRPPKPKLVRVPFDPNAPTIRTTAMSPESPKGRKPEQPQP